MATTKRPTTARSASAKGSAAKSKSVKTAKASSAKPKTKTSGKSATKSKASQATKPATKVSSSAKSSKAASRSKAAASATSRRPATAKGKKGSAPRKRNAATKPKGIISSAINTVAGLFSSNEPDAIDLLKKDHDTVEKLFEKVKANEDGNNVATFKKIKAELDVHAHIEEKIFYPHLLEKGDKELKKIVREGIEEHRQVKMFLSELDALSGDTAKFKAKLTVLIEDVEHHVKEEEDDMFPMVEDQIDAEMLQRLGSLMYGEKLKVKRMTPQKAAAATSK